MAGLCFASVSGKVLRTQRCSGCYWADLALLLCCLSKLLHHQGAGSGHTPGRGYNWTRWQKFENQQTPITNFIENVNNDFFKAPQIHSWALHGHLHGLIFFWFLQQMKCSRNTSMNKMCTQYLAHGEKTDSLSEESIQTLPTNQAKLKTIKT